MRRFFAIVFVTLALGTAACRQQPEGAIKTVVIGDEAKLRDPALGALPAADAVLLQNAAQGLVQFDAGGNIVPGLAERWAVSDDGLSYTFRIAKGQWSNGRDITADQVARVLKRDLAERSKDPIKDSLGSIEDIVAMTDRVIEIQLVAPRPNLLPLLAQPEFSILRNGEGTGPFKLASEPRAPGTWALSRSVLGTDEEDKRTDRVLLSGQKAAQAITGFAQGRSDLVLGGTFVDLPFVRQVKLPRNSLRFDPASGLFGLVPVRTAAGALADADLRKLLNQAIDRDAFVAALGVPNLAPRTTLLEPGLDGMPPFAAPDWTAIPLAQRLPGLKATVAKKFGKKTDLTIGLVLPEGPGAEMILRQLQHDWGAIGFKVQRAPATGAVAAFALIDEVAPSSSPAWFIRRFRCGTAVVCDSDADKLMDSAREAPVPAQRYTMLAQAAGLIDQTQLFLPLTAPIRWSLVSKRIQNFAGNRYARHTLTDLDQRPSGD